ncbi:hypothetical protein FRC11_008117, partial [Ceratobasidium sp. 423]
MPNFSPIIAQTSNKTCKPIDFRTTQPSRRSLHIRNKLKAQLEVRNNAWANDQAIARVIVKMGKYFLEVNVIDTEVECYKPETEFPELVKIILEGLEAMDLGIEQQPAKP